MALGPWILGTGATAVPSGACSAGTACILLTFEAAWAATTTINSWMKRGTTLLPRHTCRVVLLPATSMSLQRPYTAPPLLRMATVLFNAMLVPARSRSTASWLRFGVLSRRLFLPRLEVVTLASTALQGSGEGAVPSAGRAGTRGGKTRIRSNTPRHSNLSNQPRVGRLEQDLLVKSQQDLAAVGGKACQNKSRGGACCAETLAPPAGDGSGDLVAFEEAAGIARLALLVGSRAAAAPARE